MPDFPALNLGYNTSADPVPLLAPANADALASISQAADHFGANLQDMAERAAKTSAQGQAVSDATAAGATGQLTAADAGTVYGATYNTVAQQLMGVQRQAAMREAMGNAYVANPNNPAQLDQTFAGIRSAFQPTGFKDLDATLDGDFALQRSDYMVKAATGLRDQVVAQGQANFASTLEQGMGLLSQTANGASFDAGGSSRVAGAYAQLIQSLGRYGPKEAFDVGGVHFDADPTRLAAVGPDDLTKVALAAHKQATLSWIDGQADRLTTSTAKATFVSDLRQRYAAGDPQLGALDGTAAEQLFGHLDDEASKADTAERAVRELHVKNALSQIDALRYGGDNYDRNTMLAEAQASGDPGTIAATNFYASVEPQVRGVLRTVVARADGLIPEPGAGQIPPVALDAAGRPIGPVAPPAAAGFSGAPGGGLMPLQAPVAGRVTSGFGPRVAPMAGASTYHAGVDIAVPIGTPVGAAGDGVVVSAGPRGGYGNAVTIRHADGSTTLYGHLSQVSVQPGQQVQGGQPIGLSGSTGVSTGPHVHFGRYDASGRPVDPMSGQPPNTWAPPPDVAPGSAAAVAWANTKADFTTDPLRYVQGHNLAAVPPLLPAAGFSDDPAASAQFATTMQQRLALSTTIARKYIVPLRLFTNGEQDALKSQLQQDPTSGVVLARHLQAAIGDQGATDALRELGESGADALTQLHLGTLQVLGHTTLVQAAADGMRLRTEGAEIPKWSTPGGAPVRNFDTVMGEMAPAFQAQPDVLQAIRNIADDARLSDMRRGITRTPDWYMQHAAGGDDVNGVAFGGVGNVNGQPALLPTWLRQDAGAQALQTLAHGWQLTSGGPVYANGQPMGPGDVGKAQLVARPNGTYWLVNPTTNQVLKRRDGSVFVLNFDQAKGPLAQVMPDAVLH